MLCIKDLTVEFKTSRGMARAVDGVSISLARRRVLGIVGESGSGKSTLLLAVMGLLPRATSRVRGKIIFENGDLLSMPAGQLRKIRGKDIGMVFQDPMATLNPVYNVGDQVLEVLRVHNYRQPGEVRERSAGRERKKRVLQLMQEVGIPSPDKRYGEFPHQFSGGMQQRILIAIALACEPRLLLLDEPTTALDVTIQAQIVDLLRGINARHEASMILVTHNMALAAEFCHDIAVMYAGRIVETGPVDAVMHDPFHPYTRGLLKCLPRIGRREKLEVIPGTIPDLISLPAGCCFADRCPEAMDVCFDRPPEPGRIGENHYSLCQRAAGECF